MTDKIIEILFKHEEPFQDTGLSFVPRWKYKTIAKELLEAINFIQCCESDSEQLCLFLDVTKNTKVSC